MNQRAEVSIEALINDRVFRLTLPSYAPFEDSFSFLDQVHLEVERMQAVAIEQHKKWQEQQKPSTAPAE